VRGGGASHDDFPGVEISIAGGVGEIVCANYCDCFFFFSFLFIFIFFQSRLLIVSIGGKCTNVPTPTVLGTTDIRPE